MNDFLCQANATAAGETSDGLRPTSSDRPKEAATTTQDRVIGLLRNLRSPDARLTVEGEFWSSHYGDDVRAAVVSALEDWLPVTVTEDAALMVSIRPKPWVLSASPQSQIEVGPEGPSDASPAAQSGPDTK